MEIVNPEGKSELVLIGDHAGNLLPSTLNASGMNAGDLTRHIAWDTGVDALGRRLAVLLDAVFVRQRYSRLVIDCNRDPRSAEAMPVESDGTPIPFNVGLSAEARRARVAQIHEPYQATVAAALKGRRGAHLISLHSFTPNLAGQSRPWQLGVLHNGHSDQFARRLLEWLRKCTDLQIGDNEPYRMDTTDYTVPYHVFGKNMPYVELEVRQDLLVCPSKIESFAELIALALNRTR